MAERTSVRRAEPGAQSSPVILFGACDRHNLGDLLFPHIAAGLLAPRPCIVAGVAERDLTAYGGHRVAAIARLASAWGDQAAQVVHVGGELLSCSLYEAAVMTLTPQAAAAVIARVDRDEQARQAWAEAQLGLRQRAGYLVPKALFRRPGRFVHQALGGVDLPRLPGPMRQEVLERLRETNWLTVRDRATQAALAEAGIRADLAPDAAELTAELCGARIARHAGKDEPGQVRERFPQGYTAMQFSAEFADDASLDRLAAHMDGLATATGLGIVLFRAGAAPWHDDLAAYRRLAGRLKVSPAWIFASLHIWEICALLAQARLYIGSSLHGRIIAGAYAVPGVNLASPAQSGPISKQSAYLATWHSHASPGVVPPQALGAAARAALDQPQAVLAVAARQRAHQARQGWVGAMP